MKTKEERFRELMNGYCVAISSEFPEIIYLRGEKFLLECDQKYGYTCIDNNIWSIFKEEYNIGNSEISKFINEVLLKDLNIKAEYGGLNHVRDNRAFLRMSGISTIIPPLPYELFF